ncbi:PepSY domain-containing protein [Streptomyces exfoliatus]|uniref:PepSY domain-containing protein n=1 Tax=Streptomyces exfoliatus TaxID=1905 RepID=UPI000464DC56|nr:PepSY domain-containing protein [Streptomyces exfoliatus]
MKRKLVLATAAAVALVTGGTAVALAAGGTGAAPVQQARAALDRDDERDDEREAEAAREARITAVQAIDAAVKARPGTVVSAELDDDKDDADDDGWEVVVLGARGSTTHTVHIDPVSGRVLGTDTEDDSDDRDDSDDDSDDIAAARSAKVSARQAAQTAAAKGIVTSVELTNEDDAPAGSWDVGVLPAGGAHDDDWNVDVKTGTLVD